MESITLIAPTYNEQDSVPALVDRVERALTQRPYELIFVDDSVDGTAEVIARLGAAHPHIRLIHRAGRRGLASAVSEGIAAARHGVICVLDADLQHPPEAIPRLLAALEETGADLVIASRYTGGGRYDTFTPLRRLTSYAATSAARLLLPRARRVSDPLSGFFIVRRTSVDRVALRPLGYKILLEVLVRGRIGRVVEVPYHFEARTAGQSKLTLRQQWEFLLHLARLVRARGDAAPQQSSPAPQLPALAAQAVDARAAFTRFLKHGPLPDVEVISGNGAAAPPLVSVIIPSANGNRAGHLTTLLRQLEAQPFRRFEVIIVRGDTRQGRAINTGAAIAGGEILVTMDDDTRLGDPEVLRKLVDAMDGDPAIGIAGASNLVPRDASPVVQRAMQELPRRSSPLVSEITDSDLAEHPCLAIRKDLFLRVGGEHELIPRGLDPYLRREVRALGYRVVIVPNTWIHHLLPATLRGILRQYFRNGLGAAYVQKFFPEFVIEQAVDHAEDVPARTAFRPRAARYPRRLIRAVIDRQWIYLGTLLSYAAGYAWGWLTLRQDSA